VLSHDHEGFIALSRYKPFTTPKPFMKTFVIAVLVGKTILLPRMALEAMEVAGRTGLALAS
jgi:hypothetical protein